MKKISIHKDEWYPYMVGKEDLSLGKVVEVSDEFYEKWKRVDTEHNEIQKKLYKIYNYN